MLALRLSNRIAGDFGQVLSLLDLFEAPTISSQTTLLSGRPGDVRSHGDIRSHGDVSVTLEYMRSHFRDQKFSVRPGGPSRGR